MHDDWIAAEFGRRNGNEPSGLAFWQMQQARRRRQRRGDMVGCALLVAATVMGIVIGYALCLVVRGGVQ